MRRDSVSVFDRTVHPTVRHDESCPVQHRFSKWGLARGSVRLFLSSCYNFILHQVWLHITQMYKTLTHAFYSSLSCFMFKIKLLI